jgi:hypothetical protein
MGVAKWTASGWSALPGSTLTGSVYVAELFDDGSGLALFAGGALDIAGGVFAENIAKWDGTSWSDVGGGLPEIPYGLGQFDDGSGPALYATGFQGSSGNSPTRRVARWDGSTWTPLAGDFSNSVRAYAAFDDGTGPAFFASGDFAISPTGDSYLARWGCPLPISGRAYCTAGTTSNGCVPSIGGSGVPSASAGVGFDIVVSAVEGQKAGLIFYGVSGPKAAAWGPSSSSYLCVDAPTQRMATQSSGGASGMCDGVLSEDWNAYIASHPSALGQTFAAGETIWAQAWFRDPPAPKTTNLSDALVFTLAP